MGRSCPTLKTYSGTPIHNLIAPFLSPFTKAADMGQLQRRRPNAIPALPGYFTDQTPIAELVQISLCRCT